MDDKQKKPPFRSCLNKVASDEFIWRYMHNTNLGVMNFYVYHKNLATSSLVLSESEPVYVAIITSGFAAAPQWKLYFQLHAVDVEARRDCRAWRGSTVGSCTSNRVL